MSINISNNGGKRKAFSASVAVTEFSRPEIVWPLSSFDDPAVPKNLDDGAVKIWEWTRKPRGTSNCCYEHEYQTLHDGAPLGGFLARGVRWRQWSGAAPVLTFIRNSWWACALVIVENGELQLSTQTFGTTMSDLLVLGDWLASHGVTLVGMESTGVFGNRSHPQDQEPIHAHGRYAETVVIVALCADGTVQIADRDDAILPADAKRSDVKRVLNAARDHWGEIVAAWAKMHGTNDSKTPHPREGNAD